MKVQKVRLDVNHVTWLVLDDNYLPVKPIFKFIHFLNWLFSVRPQTEVFSWRVFFVRIDFYSR